MTRTGTSYFVSRLAAIEYFADYHYPHTAATVDRKLREGEIHLGKPPIKPGQRLVLIDNDRRWAIEEEDAIRGGVK